MEKPADDQVCHTSCKKDMLEEVPLKGQVQSHELEKRGYQRLFPVGSGATSKVYCVKSVKTGKNYACKISTRKELLESEAALMKELKHPLFPAFIEFWQSEEAAYLLMEYIAGQQLSQLLKRRGRMSQKMAVDAALELADGLKFLQEFDPPVIYRDLKPENILVQNNGRIRLTDLGAACQVGREAVTREGEYGEDTVPCIYAGTPGYAAPEQWKSKGVDERSDIYAMGMVLLFMLTGLRPDGGCLVSIGNIGQGSEDGQGTALSVRAHHIRIRRELDRIIQDCTAVRTDERIPSMGELIRRLLDFRDSRYFQIMKKEINCLCHADRGKTIYYVRNVWKTVGREL